jgi:predicted nuclease of restriction endonuclease-like RecB superfamily
MESRSKKYRPHFIGIADSTWVTNIAAEYHRFAGKPFRDLRQRLKEPLPYYCPRDRFQFVCAALDDLFRGKSPHPSRKVQSLRRQLFLKSEDATFSTGDGGLQSLAERRDKILEEFGADPSMKVLGASLDQLIFSDLPSEQIVCAPDTELDISDIMLRANAQLVRSVLKRSQCVEILIRGRTRPVVRQAQLRGLVCAVEPLLSDHRYEARIFLSGPLAIFRRAKLYGQLLIEILPFLSLCDRYQLTATVSQHGGLRDWLITSGDPIAPAACKEFDSRVERLFAHDFAKASNNYDLIREPQPIQAGHHLIFPDFALKHRTDPGKSWLLEIIGYWTKAYLERKSAALIAAGIKNLVICINKNLGGGYEWPTNATIIPFDRRIDPSSVLSAIQQ